MAPGFCTCKRDFPERRSFHPPEHATWHYLCDKPVLAVPEPKVCFYCAQPIRWDEGSYDTPRWVHVHAKDVLACHGREVVPASLFVPTGTGWPSAPPEYVPDDGEAQRIAEVYADARAEQDRGL